MQIQRLFVHGAAIICKRAAEEFRELGGEIYFNTPIKSFIKENDTVTGAIAIDKDGNEIKISAKAIIVDSGGFSNNPELIKKYIGHTYSNNNCDNGGIELRSRFWIGYQIINGQPLKVISDGMSVPIETVKGLFAHNLKEFTHLATILPKVYEEEKNNF